MAEQVKKKREAKPGFKRVTVSLTEEEYKALLVESEKQMREPNNLMSFLLRGKVKGLLGGE